MSDTERIVPIVPDPAPALPSRLLRAQERRLRFCTGLQLLSATLRRAAEDFTRPGDDPAIIERVAHSTTILDRMVIDMRREAEGGDYGL
jgi:hypothetical protein